MGMCVCRGQDSTEQHFCLTANPASGEHTHTRLWHTRHFKGMTLENWNGNWNYALKEPLPPTFLSSFYPPAILHFKPYSFWWALSLRHRLIYLYIRVLRIPLDTWTCLAYRMHRYASVITIMNTIELIILKPRQPSQVFNFCLISFMKLKLAYLSPVVRTQWLRIAY